MSRCVYVEIWWRCVDVEMLLRCEQVVPLKYAFN